MRMELISAYLMRKKSRTAVFHMTVNGKNIISRLVEIQIMPTVSPMYGIGDINPIANSLNAYEYEFKLIDIDKTDLVLITQAYQNLELVDVFLNLPKRGKEKSLKGTITDISSLDNDEIILTLRV